MIETPVGITTEKETSPLDLAPDRKGRQQALLRFFLFMGLAIGLTLSTIALAIWIFGLRLDVDQPFSVQEILIANFFIALVEAVVPTAVMVSVTHGSALAFGWGRSKRWRDLGIGVATGLGSLSALLLGMSLLGGYSFGNAPLSPTRGVEYGAIYLLIFALAALSEEGSLRGYGFVQLSRAISFWPAAILLSTLFLVLHMPHKNESAVGLAQVGLVGLIFAYSFRRSGALWFALGCHASWDYAQSFLYGVPDSGLNVPGALLHPIIHGPAWLTGGPTGPEGSVLVLPVLAIQALIVHFAFPARDRNSDLAD